MNKCKFGNCTQCPKTDTNCVKVGKLLFCLSCHKKNKTQKQITTQKLKSGGGSEQQRWFEDRHKEMTGICKHCNGKTEKGQSSYKCSIAHLLPKAYFKSIATHPLNWIELCFYGKSCHTNFDNLSLDITELNCFDEVIQKFVGMYPSIAPDERRRIPKALLDYIEVEK